MQIIGDPAQSGPLSIDTVPAHTYLTTSNYEEISGEEISAEAGEVVVSNTTAINSEDTTVPVEFALLQNFPNPFNPQTSIQYDLPHASKVTLRIYSLQGQLVQQFERDHPTGGRFSVRWNGRGLNGKSVSSGTYIFHLQANEYSQSLKMLLVK
ncbi:MAG: T9SS C-terminal target domain-containing protein [Calditrichaeota bacterium]|nr:MAG: T9SS C-terminal target domain-containing protein [Calditrichota bacterium]